VYLCRLWEHRISVCAVIEVVVVVCCAVQAFFLSYSLGCLVVRDADEVCII